MVFTNFGRSKDWPPLLTAVRWFVHYLRRRTKTARYKSPISSFRTPTRWRQYQTSISNTQAFTGWGGRIADKLTAAQNPGGLVPMITSISGSQIFTAGQQTLPMAISSANNTGSPNLANVLNPVGFSSSTSSQARLTAFNQLRTADLDNNFVKQASHVTDLAMSANAALQTSQEVTVTFPNTSLGLQLKQVARLIKKRHGPECWPADLLLPAWQLRYAQ